MVFSLPVLPEVSLAVALLSGLALLLIAVIAVLLVRTKSIAHAFAEHSLADVLSSRELFYALYRNSPVPYVLLLESGAISLGNDAAMRLFGIQEDELRGKQLFDFLTAEDEPSRTHVEILSSRFSQGVSFYNEECTLRRPDGQVRYVLLSLFPVSSKDNPHRGLAALVDITKQKEVDKAKTEFVSLASHQLRSPIASLRWNLELLGSPRAGVLSEKQHEYVVTLERGIERMSSLVDDFLSMSRLELGMLTAARSRIVVNDFVADIVRDFRNVIDEKKLDVTTDIDIGIISSDPPLLRHIVGNILGNAVKYTASGGKVRLRAYESERSVIFEISDNGIGIPEEEQGGLFEKFFRASNAKSAASEGTGLGLYIVKLAVDALGGSISFASRPGLGTAFTVRLPE